MQFVGVSRLALVILVLAALAGAGCSGGGGSSSGTPSGGGSGGTDPGTPTATVVVQHDLLPRGVPSSVTDFRFTGRNAAGTALYGPVTVPRAASVTLTDVPVTVTSLLLEYLEGSTVVGVYVAPVSLSAGGTFTVTDPPYLTETESVQVAPGAPSLAAGTSQALTATALFADSSVQDVTSSSAWTTSNPAVATVSPGGVVTAVAPGQAVVTATFDQVPGTATVTVTAAVLQALEVAPATVSLPEGTTQQFTATGTFTDGTVQDLTSQVAWSSDDGGVATVDGAGLGTAVAEGRATVTATLGAASGSATVFVTRATLESLQVTPTLPVVAQGTLVPFLATGTFSDGSTRDVTSLATWTTDTPAVAVVSNASGSQGVVTALSPGSSTVTATVDGVSGDATVAVTAATLVSLQVTPSSASLPAGLTQQFTALGTYSDGTVQDLTGQVSWSSTPAVATVSGTGLATAVAPGQTSVTATALGGVSGSATLFVTQATLVGLQVTPASPSIAHGTTQQFVATGTFTDGSTRDVTSLADWSSDDLGVATMSNAAGSRGLATGNAEGTATITASLEGIPGPATLTVTAAVLESLEVAPPAAQAPAGASVQFTATGTFSDGSTQDLTAQVTWTPDDPAVATVDAAGLATGAGPGLAEITASLDGVQASGFLTVTAPLLQSVGVTPAGATLLGCGLVQQYTATASYSDGSTQDVTSQAVWASTNPSAASVGVFTGLVTTGEPGATTLSATFGGEVGTTGLTVESSPTPLLEGPAGYGMGDEPGAVAAGDFDGVNGPDLAVADLDDNEVFVLLNLGDGTFAAPVVYPVGFTCSAVAVGDFDGTNGPDLAVANGDFVSVLLNDGTGAFGAAVPYATGGGSEGVAVGDFDGANGPDLAVASADASAVSVLFNLGDGTFAGLQDFPVGLSPKGVAVGDFDGAGGPDLAVTNQASNTVSVLLNTGGGVFAPAASLAVGLDPRGVAVGDFDGSGRPDLAVANHDDGDVSVLLNTGGGGFAPRVDYPAAAGAEGVASADFDGSGRPDLAVTAGSGATVVLLRNGGTGTFGPPAPEAVGDGPEGLAAADFDGSGSPDLAVANLDSGSVTVLLDAGDGTLGPFAPLPTGVDPAAVAVADLDGDGDLDLVSADRSDSTVSVLRRQADGTYAAAVAYGTGSIPFGVVVADFDRVNGPDLAINNLGDDTVTVRYNTGNGTFAGSATFAVGDNPFSMAMGDFDGVNGPDLATADRFTDTLTILLNQGDGTFVAAAPLPTGDRPAAVVSADFDRNGTADLAVACQGDDVVQVFLNAGGASFVPSTPYPGPISPIEMAVGDFDGVDGPDLVANSDTDEVLLFPNQGDGTFGAPVASPAGRVNGLAVGDLNCDGRPDLLLSSDLPRVLLNLGSGVFQGAAPFGVAGDGVALADLDGDGLLEGILAAGPADGLVILPDTRTAAGP